MIKVLEFIADNSGIAYGVLFAVLIIAVIVRVIAKTHRGEKVEITPVGIVNDLPDSVTGMNKYSDALTAEDNQEKE